MSTKLGERQFDHLGRHISTEMHEHGNWTEADELVKRRLLEVGFEAATIRVNRFNLGDWWIADYPFCRGGELDEVPWGPPQGWIDWLKNGCHSFDYIDTNDEWWLNRDGELIDT